MSIFPSKLRRSLTAACCASLIGCSGAKPTTTTQPHLAGPVTKVAPPTPIEVKRVEIGGPTWNPDWDRVVERALPRELLSAQVPQDVRLYCPRFYQMNETDKRTFWAYFFQALAGAEAGLDPKTNVRHTEPEVAVPDAVTGHLIHSEGLLQLTYEDATRYGCDFDWQFDRNRSAKDPAKTILQPDNNLLCGVKILTNQIITQHKPLFSPSSYWSTLRPGTESYAVFTKQMTNPPAACGRRAVKARTACQTLKSPAQTWRDRNNVVQDLVSATPRFRLFERFLL
jgi:hypothetical protein